MKILSIIFSILVVSSSTVYSVLWLTGTFMIVSLMLGLLNLGFPALIYVIVYIGAIAILFLFVIQLIDTGNKQTITGNRSYSVLTLILSLGMISIALVANNTLSNTRILSNDLLFVSSVNIYNPVQAKSGVSTQVESLAEWLYGPGLLPLIIVSVVLLVAMIAPIYLCENNNI